HRPIRAAHGTRRRDHRRRQRGRGGQDRGDGGGWDSRLALSRAARQDFGRSVARKIRGVRSVTRQDVNQALLKTSFLYGAWPATEKAVADKLRAKAAEASPKEAPSEDEIRRATRDSVRALMMIRAYRMRGHLYANLDPLGLEPQRDHEELHPSTYGFQESDYDRSIFIDHVLGLEFATV